MNYILHPTQEALQVFFTGNLEKILRNSDYKKNDHCLNFKFLVLYILNNVGCALFCLCNGSTISRETGNEQFTHPLRVWMLTLLPANTWQEIFKSCSNQHHGFVDSIEKDMVLLKIGAGNDNKIFFLKSDIMFRSRGKTFFYSQSHTSSLWKTFPTPVCGELPRVN